MSDIRSLPHDWLHPIIINNEDKYQWVKLKRYELYSVDFRIWCDNLAEFFKANTNAQYYEFVEVFGEKPHRVNYMPKFRDRFTMVDVHYYNDVPSIPADIYIELVQVHSCIYYS